MKKLLIIKAGTTFEWIREKFGDFDDFIIKQIGMPAKDVCVVPIFIMQSLPPLTDVSAVIITGSHAMVTDQEEWSINLCAWLRGLAKKAIPVLGICYGHQLIARAFGGVVDYHPRGKEVGTVKIQLSDGGQTDALFDSFPDTFLGHVTHAQTVLKLPSTARLLAYNAYEPHHAYVIHDHLWGVQFHPEFNESITQSYIEAQASVLVQEGHDVAEIRSSVVDHEYGKLLLRNFIKLAG